MKTLLALAPLMLLFFSCKKEVVIISDSNELQQQPAWKSEKLKADYTIQFPGYYNGGYVQGFEGGSFDKLRDDTRLHYTYSYSNGLQYSDFGDTLPDESIDSISVGDLLLVLPYRISLTENGDTVGILFYNDVGSVSTGVLYWKDAGVFKNALRISYANELKEEMLTILKTIRHN